MPSWSPSDLPDLTGTVVLVTGANSGLGLETCKHAAKKNATVVMACRSEAKAKAAVAEVEGVAGSAASVSYVLLDLQSLESIQAFPDQLPVDHIDALVNNAGVMMLPFGKTKDGFELQVGTNHLGHFALTGRLLPLLLRSSKQARIVNVSSMMSQQSSGPKFLEDLNSERSYNRIAAYSNSKLCQHWFTRQLNKVFADAGVAEQVMAVTAHPGYAATNLQYSDKGWLTRAFLGVSNFLFADTPEKGSFAQTFAALAEDERIKPDGYYGPMALFGMRGRIGVAAAPRHAANTEAAANLWKQSVALTGVEYHV